MVNTASALSPAVKRPKASRVWLFNNTTVNLNAYVTEAVPQVALQPDVPPHQAKPAYGQSTQEAIFAL